MTIDINQIWTLLSDSQLVNAAQTQKLFTKFSTDSQQPKDSESLTKWLVEQKAISPYHATIFKAGHCGPFRYGSYCVNDRIAYGPLKGDFKARHAKTGHPVLLQFIAGGQAEDLKTWYQIEAKVEQLTSIQHPSLNEAYDAVALPNRRFIVLQMPNGSPLLEQLPPKGRLPWKKACTLVAQVANGLEQIHKQGKIVHNAVSPRTIWVGKAGLAQLFYSPVADQSFDAPNSVLPDSECKFDYMAPECFSPSATPLGKYADELGSDLYSLGCTLFRMISGRVLFPESDLEKKKQQHKSQPLPSLKKYELPSELETLIQQLLSKKPSDRPSSAQEVGNLLGLLSGKAAEISSISMPKSNTRSAFRRTLAEFLPNQNPASSTVPSIKIEFEPKVESPESSLSRREKIKAAADSAARRKNGKWKMPAAIAGGLLALTALVAAFAFTANNKVLSKPEEPVPPNIDTLNPDIVSPVETPLTLAELPPKKRPTLLQLLIEDDDQSLWESPTNGPPIELNYLPSAAKIVFVIRPSDLVSDDEGNRVLNAVGPSLFRQIQDLQNQLGITLESIEELVVSLHTNADFEYESYFVVRLNQPVPFAQMMQNWNRPAPQTLENQQTIFASANGDSSYYIVYESSEKEDIEQAEDESRMDEPGSDGTTVSRFAFGPTDLIEDAALNLGATVLPTSLASLAQSTDRNRHLNILFLRNALFNEEGQKLMGLDHLALNRELGIMVPDNVRGGLLSLHLDSGSYFELMLDKNVDLKASDLKNIMIDAFRNRRDMLLSFVARIPASPYWDNVRIRYGSMLASFYQNLRWNVEHGDVVANCWLPPMAAHNLIAASEHVIAFAAGTSSTAEPVATGPQTLDELLSIKRDLNIANPPDLNVLLANIQLEVTDDFPQLPFAFNIRLIGSDLEKEGITKNQRPSELVMSQKSLAEILTSIMTSANPSKDISGPNDPNCKLIWVVAEDPKISGQKAILVTTRAAAAQKSYQLPPAVRTE